MTFIKSIHLSFIFLLFFVVSKAQREPYIPPEGDGFAVLELFTSEGCSSCPAADKAMTQLAGEYKQHFYTLEFHVDYWNHLGWKDQYANEAYTARQKHYKELLGCASLYTPQVIINGNAGVVGSDKAKIRPLLNQAILQEPKATLKVTATAHINRVYVSYHIDGTMGQLLNVALVQRKVRTDVRKGENEGRKLNHTNVVRYFKTLELVEDHGFVEVLLPEGIVAEECVIIAYTQKKRTWMVTSVAQCAIMPESH